MRTWLVILLLGCALATPRSLAAQDAVIDWQAPAGCPDVNQVRAGVAALLARGSAGARAPSFTGRIMHNAAKYALLLEIDVGGKRVTRSLEADDCGTLADTAAWLVALAVDPSVPEPPPSTTTKATDATASTTNEAKPAKNDAAQPGKTRAPATAAADASDDDREGTQTSRASRWRLRGSAFGGLVAAGLAGAAATLGARVGTEHGPWLIDATFALQLPQTLALGAGTSSEITAQRLGVAGCWLLGERSRVGVCAELSVSRLHGEASGVADPQPSTFFTSYAGASLLGTQRLFGPLELWADAALLVPLSTRPRFEVEGAATAAEASFVAGVLRAGLGIVLP